MTLKALLDGYMAIHSSPLDMLDYLAWQMDIDEVVPFDLEKHTELFEALYQMKPHPESLFGRQFHRLLRGYFVQSPSELVVLWRALHEDQFDTLLYSRQDVQSYLVAVIEYCISKGDVDAPRLPLSHSLVMDDHQRVYQDMSQLNMTTDPMWQYAMHLLSHAIGRTTLPFNMPLPSCDAPRDVLLGALASEMGHMRQGTIQDIQGRAKDIGHMALSQDAHTLSRLASEAHAYGSIGQMLLAIPEKSTKAYMNGLYKSVYHYDMGSTVPKRRMNGLLRRHVQEIAQHLSSRDGQHLGPVRYNLDAINGVFLMPVPESRRYIQLLHLSANAVDAIQTHVGRLLALILCPRIDHGYCEAALVHGDPLVRSLAFFCYGRTHTRWDTMAKGLEGLKGMHVMQEVAMVLFQWYCSDLHKAGRMSHMDSVTFMEKKTHLQQGITYIPLSQ